MVASLVGETVPKGRKIFWAVTDLPSGDAGQLSLSMALLSSHADLGAKIWVLSTLKVYAIVNLS